MAAHMAPLYNLMEKHGMILQKEEDELAAGKQGDKRLKSHGNTASGLDTKSKPAKLWEAVDVK